MSDEEEDYMSDAFLASIAADAAPADKSSGDVRKYSAAQRKRDMEKKAAIAAEKSRTKPLSLRYARSLGLAGDLSCQDCKHHL